MEDKILSSFLKHQFVEGMALARASDILRLTPVHGDPPTHYIASFAATGLVQDPQGEIVEAPGADFGIALSADYLRQAQPGLVVTYLGPHPRPWHPNIRPPYICVHLLPGTPLVDLLYACFELWTWTLYSTRDEGLNHEAAQWARNQPSGRFPIDRRPLKRRTLTLAIEPVEAGASHE